MTGLNISSSANVNSFGLLDPIVVHVGENKTVFQIPQNLICVRSTFFAAACSDRWNIESPKVVPLPDDSPAVFSVYLQVLYTNQLVVERTEHDDPCDMTWTRSVQTYVLADKLGDRISMNLIMTEMVRQLRDRTVEVNGAHLGQAVRYAYDHSSTATSPLRRVFVDYTVHFMSTSDLDRLVQKMGAAADFLYDVAMESISHIRESGCQGGRTSFAPKMGKEYHVEVREGRARK